MGSDSMVVAALRAEGFTVLNPCLDVRILHNHCSGLRQPASVHRAGRRTGCRERPSA